MAISDLTTDARDLWSRGRRDSALLLILVAVAARAREQFPDERSDRARFERLLASSSNVRLSVEFRGVQHSIEHVLYRWFRNALVHEAGLPTDVEWLDEADPGELVIRAGGKPAYVLGLSPSWFDHLERVALQDAGPVR